MNEEYGCDFMHKLEINNNTPLLRPIVHDFPKDLYGNTWLMSKFLLNILLKT